MNEPRKLAKGRPSVFQPAYCSQARMLCLLGATDAQIAAAFGVNEATINRWKKRNPEFIDAMNSGKMQADARVAAALFKRATGFRYHEETFEKMDGKASLERSSEGDITIGDTYRKKVVTKIVPPDTAAASLWLRNRQRLLWRDRQDFSLDIDSLSDDQIEFIIQELLKRGGSNVGSGK